LFIYDAAVLPLAVLWIAHGRSDDEAQDLAGWACLLVLALLVPTRAIIGVQLSVVLMLWMLYHVTASYQHPASRETKQERRST
jgi:hypothetical protein